jgi:hypothetical protein
MACLKCPRSMAVRAIWHAPAVILKRGEAASARPARYTPVQRRDLLSLHDAGALFLFDACIGRDRESRGDKRRSHDDGESLVSELHVVQPPRVDVDAVLLPTREQQISTMLSSLWQRRDRSCLVWHRTDAQVHSVLEMCRRRPRPQARLAAFGAELGYFARDGSIARSEGRSACLGVALGALCSASSANRSHVRAMSMRMD